MESYGYGFPEASERLAILADHLEIISRMFVPGPVTFEGRHASMHGALHEPVGLQQPRIPSSSAATDRTSRGAWPLASPTS